MSIMAALDSAAQRGSNAFDGLSDFRGLRSGFGNIHEFTEAVNEQEQWDDAIVQFPFDKNKAIEEQEM